MYDWLAISVTINIHFINRTRLRNSKTFKLCKYDMIIICLSGLVKGTISFALIQYLSITPLTDGDKD